MAKKKRFEPEVAAIFRKIKAEGRLIEEDAMRDTIRSAQKALDEFQATSKISGPFAVASARNVIINR
jgi:hypothetical protein